MVGEYRLIGGATVPLYLGRFLFDTVVYGRQTLEFLIDLVGIERVLFGTDQNAARAYKL